MRQNISETSIKHHLRRTDKNASEVLDIERLQQQQNKRIQDSAVARPNGQPRQAGVARGVRGHDPPPPREILNFSLSEMRFTAFSGRFGNFFRVNLSGI